MNKYKILIEESDYLQRLLKVISNFSDFSSVPEMLYYEALVSYKYLKESNSNSETAEVLYSFIKMCENSKIVQSYEYSDLFCLKKQKFSKVKVSSGNIDTISYTNDSWLRLLKPLGVGTVVSFIFLGMVVLFWCGVFTTLLSFLEFILGMITIAISLIMFSLALSDGAWVLIHDHILFKKSKNQVFSISTSNIDDRTRQLARSLPRRYRKLAKQFITCNRYTKEYYDACSDIELAYIKEKYF